MLAIRLRRIGKKSQPSYRLVVSEKSKTPNSKVLEFLGNYNPAISGKPASLKKERILHWISKGAKPSATVHNLLLREGVVEGDKVKSFNIPTKVKVKKAEDNKKKEEEKKQKIEEPVAEESKVSVDENKDVENKEEASV
ncbi:30S ribosomal protein S16 [Patescibacteria group bacterium]|nr:30S ribosomal protein S16 [Patescibacteria group bacterium]